MRQVFLTGVAIAALTLSMPAVAQTASTSPDADTDATSEQGEPGQDIVIVGSRSGGRTNFQSMSPVRAIGKDQIESAATQPGELGAIIAAQVPNFTFSRDSNNGAADSVRTGQLRGLKPDQTLVLINGKRAHTTAVYAVEGGAGQYTAPFDFNTVPTNAIGRVEVLSDGAGAQYGSDAIAGVLNIVLDDRNTGGELSVSYGQRHTGFDPIGQRLNDGRTFSISGDYGFRLGDRGFLRFGGEALFRGATNRAGYSQDENGVRGPIPFEANPFLPNSPRNDAVALAGRVMTAGDGLSQGGSGFFNLQYALDDTWTYYGFGTMSYRSTEGAAFFRWPADWGGSGPEGNRNPGPVYPDGYRPVTTGENFDFQGTSGVRGTLGNWDVDLSLSTGRDNFVAGVTNSLNPSMGAASPRTFTLYRARSQQISVNADVTRRIEIGLANPLNIAGGLEYRFERFATRPGDPASYTSGPLIQPVGAEAGPGLSPIDAGQQHRNVAGAYIDLSLQPVEALTLGAAGRYERYDDFGGTLNGKLSARVALTPWLAVRGAVSTNYRAPSLSQLTTQLSSQAFSEAANGLVTNLTLAPSSPIAALLGFGTLKPEKSRNLSAGVAVSQGGFSASIDYFNLRLRDAITVYPTVFGDDVTSFLLQRTGRPIDSLQLLQNLDALTRFGLDVATNYRFAAGDGKIDLGLFFSMARSVANSATFAVPPQLSALGYAPLAYQTTVYPRYVHNLITSVNYTRRGIALMIRGTRFDSMLVGIRSTDTFQDLSSKWTFDVSASQDVTRNLKIEVGAQNLFDVYPDRQDYRNTYYGALPYASTQMGFLGAYYYARAQVRF